MNTREVEIEAPWGSIAIKLWGNEDNIPILVVHGIMDNAGSFDRLIPLLPKQYFYICIDLPGHGKSSHFPPNLPIHSTNYLIVYKLVMDHFKSDKYIIMGHSYGGQLGYLFTQLYPEKVDKLILLDTLTLWPIEAKDYTLYLAEKYSAYFDLEKKIKNRAPPQYTYEEALERIIKGHFIPIHRKAAEPLLPRILIPKENGKYELSVDQRLKFSINPMHDVEYSVKTFKENPVRCPILVVLATDHKHQTDIFIPLLNEFKKRNNISMKYVPGNHDVHNESPESVAPHVIEFLSQHKNKL